MTAGTDLGHRILSAIGGLPFCRLFRHNVGMGWAGRSTRMPNGDRLVKAARPLRAGLVVGGSDLIGWTTITITPEDVGRQVAVFTAIEVKAGDDRLDDDQERFIRNVKAAGGFAGHARSIEHAREIIGA